MKIQAHRGASKDCPENSLASFKRAIELGADIIELDVYKLSDGTIAVHHDDYLGRCEDASGYICDYDRDRIKSFSIGKGFDEKYSETTVPFLEEVLELVYETEVGLNIEIKYQGINGIIDDIATMLYNYRMTKRCMLSSFTKTYVLQVKEKYPRIKAGIIYASPFTENVFSFCKKYNIDAISPFYKLVDRDFMKRSFAERIEVNPWTVNKEENMKKMHDLGVYSIITDDVALAVKYK